MKLHYELAVALASLTFAASYAYVLSPDGKTKVTVKKEEKSFNKSIEDSAKKLFSEGREIFRYDTFGSEAFWGDQLKLHEAIKGEKKGGLGSGLSPKVALGAGLKVDVKKLPDSLVQGLKTAAVNLDDPDSTLALLRADAVVGIKGIFEGKNLKSVGITCALCHSTVDNSLASGIGNKLDGWPNRDLNVGAIVGMAPNLNPISEALDVDKATVQKVLASWGPGRYDAQLNMDGKAFRPDGKTSATVLPAAFGLAGVNLHTYSGWGSVTHWNGYVANTQMYGQGTFFDPRLNDEKKFPLAVKNSLWNKRSHLDLVTSKLAALHFYQLAIPAPTPEEGSFNKEMAQRGESLFNGKAKCMSCHVPPLYTEPGWNMHTAEEIGIDDFQAKRSPDERYRTTPLKGLFTRVKGGFYHDGRFPTYRAVIDHYDSVQKLTLNENEKEDLVEFLKSL